MENVLVLIPARYQSTRFPGKPLAKINDKYMIELVYNSCLHPGFDVCVVTDDERIEKVVKGFQGQVVRVDDDVQSGTERIYLAYQRAFSEKNYKYIINVQGDEPLVDPQILEDIVNFQMQNEFDIATVVKARKSELDDYINPNNVKAVLCLDSGRCLYFSRSPVPFARDHEAREHLVWHHHIGIYSFKVDSLVRFCEKAPSRLELLESLEQLRALEMGMSIGAIVTKKKLMGVDTEEDIKKVEGILNAK